MVQPYFSKYKLLYKFLIGLRLLDTSGDKESFWGIKELYNKKPDGIILSYDITNKESFKVCQYYYCKKIKELCKPNIKIILIGNKKDLEDRREISIKEGNDFALSNGYLFMETSCKKNENVYEAFEKIIEAIFEEKKSNFLTKSEKISITNKSSKIPSYSIYDTYNKFKNTICFII